MKAYTEDKRVAAQLPALVEQVRGNVSGILDYAQASHCQFANLNVREIMDI